MARSENQHQHLRISDWVQPEDFGPRRPQTDPDRPPLRNRTSHGRHLRGQLDSITQELDSLKTERADHGLGTRDFVYVEFESYKNSYLTLKSLDDRRSGVEIVAVRHRGDRMVAAVYIPDDKIGWFYRRLDRYLDRSNDTSSGRPSNSDLIDSIQNLRRAVLDSLWTDDHKQPPQDDSQYWWEVWLRTSDNDQSLDTTVKRACDQLQVHMAPETLRFPEREVHLVLASRDQLEQLIKLYDVVAEIRSAATSAEFFVTTPTIDQHAWSQSLADRTERVGAGELRTTLLDTGVNRSHPLIKDFLPEESVHTVYPESDTSDWHGHGTSMAGLSLYGDLTNVLDSNQPIQIKHDIESVRLFDATATPGESLYGNLTQEAVYRARVEGPARRVIHMAITNDNGPLDGRPTSWSAAIDQLCYGDDIDDGETPKALFLISAGNTLIRDSRDFATANSAANVEDPAQAWNALTVGAATYKTSITEPDLSDWHPLAAAGDISPFTTTSNIWDSKWPIKPDVVFEGGNLASDQESNTAMSAASLSVLSTGHDITRNLFVDVRETSAATAQVSRIAAEIWATYPDLWPESVRGLVVHSARWTPAMIDRFGSCDSEQSARQLVRSCGWGVPDIDRASWSVDNDLSLIAENTIQPYHWVERDAKSYEMVLHELPWPREELLALAETNVRLRITLSYFIEPNPARTGWTYKHLYQSYGLRFKVKAPLESVDDFRKRVNVAARDDDWVEGATPDNDRWSLGRVGHRGSIHSDIWSGTAAELAEKSAVAVYPIVGWWRERKHLERVDTQVRYCLLVSIEAPEADVDLYTPIAVKVAPALPV